MLKNNLPQNYLAYDQGNSARLAKHRVAGLALKLVLVGLMLAGVAMAARGKTAKQPNISNAPQAGEVAGLPYAVAAESSVKPGPSLLTIPSLKIAAPFELLGIKSDHTIQVPKDYMSVGWFVYGAKPGEIGTSVIIGHLDSPKGRAIFADLSKIKIGEKIVIQRTDGSIVTYIVESTAKYSQDNFPTNEIYSPVAYAGIRLITCSGTYNKNAKHYSDNFVVFGRKI